MRVEKEAIVGKSADSLGVGPTEATLVEGEEGDRPPRRKRTLGNTCVCGGRCGKGKKATRAVDG